MGNNDISINSLNKIAFMPVGNNKNGLDLSLIKDKKMLAEVFSWLFDYDLNAELSENERTKIFNTIGSNILTPKKLKELNSKIRRNYRLYK